MDQNVWNAPWRTFGSSLILQLDQPKGPFSSKVYYYHNSYVIIEIDQYNTNTTVLRQYFLNMYNYNDTNIVLLYSEYGAPYAQYLSLYMTKLEYNQKHIIGGWIELYFRSSFRPKISFKEAS